MTITVKCACCGTVFTVEGTTEHKNGAIVLEVKGTNKCPACGLVDRFVIVTDK